MGYQNSGSDTFVLGLKSEGCCNRAKVAIQPPTGNTARAAIPNPSNMMAATTPHGCVLEWSQIFIHDDRFLRVVLPLGAAAEGEPTRSGLSTTRARTGVSSPEGWLLPSGLFPCLLEVVGYYRPCLIARIVHVGGMAICREGWSAHDGCLLTAPSESS